MEPENSVQVLFVGSSIVFCDIVPAVIFQETGITSYLVAGPQQTMPIAYYCIREACKTQKPEAVFVELRSLFFPQYGEHTIANYAFMPRGLNRLEAILKTARKEDVPGLLFPVLDYHDRWNDITWSELSERLRPATVSANAGYMKLEYAEEQGEITSSHPDTSYTRECVSYLKKISDFCSEQGISLYVFYAPATNTVDQETKDKVIQLIRGLNISGYYDYTTEEALQEIGLDKKVDWADDIHLNGSGAEVFSAYLGKLLDAEGLKPSHLDLNLSIWLLRINDFYSEMIE